MKKNSTHHAKAALASGALILGLFTMGGCVSKSIYDRDVDALFYKLQAERASNAETVKQLETRISDRGRSLSELTNRYIVLEKEKEVAQAKINNLRSDMDAIMKDMAELKMIINANVRGSVANEMIMKLMEMQNRIDVIIGKPDARKISN